MERILTVLAGFICVSLIAMTDAVAPSTCTQCMRNDQCKPPDCFCCRDDLSLPIPLARIPQIVFFTFDDAVTDQVAGFYRSLFDKSRKNPNGCPISMTLFISHDNTKYGLVSDFHRRGMEIASHSVTHNAMNGSNFFEEAKAQRENLAKLANIPITDITGWRSPFLKPAGDLQPDALKQLGYNYDATLTFSKRSFAEKPPGPFTLDFGYPYECQVKPCPRHKHPGFWEVPVVSLMDYKQKYDCVYVDGCMNAPPDEESAYKFLWDNFHSYYSRTKMPFGINMHPSWFFYPDRLKAMDRFIEKLVTLDDVYIISANKMLEWLKRPVPLHNLHSFAPWACDGRETNFNSGPRLVKTNIPPPPPLSWNPFARLFSRQNVTPAKPFNLNRDSSSISNRNNTFQFIPTIPTVRDRHRQMNRVRLPDIVATELRDSPKVSRSKSLRKGKLTSSNFEIQQQKIREEIRRQKLLNEHNAKVSHNPIQAPSNNRFPFMFNRDFANKDVIQTTQLEANPAMTPPVVRRELMEEHMMLMQRKNEMEENLRKQKQILQQQQRRLELEKHQLLLKKTNDAKNVGGNTDRSDRKPKHQSRNQQSILWRAASQGRNFNTNTANKDKWAKAQSQKSTKVWPVNTATKSGRRSNGRNTDMNFDQSNTRDQSARRINTFNLQSRKMQRNPGRDALGIAIRHPIVSNTNRHAWYMNNRRSRNGPRFTRGGSNRRPGTFQRPSPQRSFNNIRQLQSQPNRQTHQDSFPVVPLTSSRDRVQSAFNIRQNQSNDASSRQSATRNSDTSGQNFLPSQAQSNAWDSFIRTMIRT